LCSSCNSVSQCNNTAIHAAVNISFVVFLLTVVLVATNDSNKDEVKSTYGGGGEGADVIHKNFQGQPLTADTRTGHLLYTAYSATCALLCYVITDDSLGNY